MNAVDPRICGTCTTCGVQIVIVCNGEVVMNPEIGSVVVCPRCRAILILGEQGLRDPDDAELLKAFG